MTRIGIIVRCDDRGLGNQTWEVYRHLPYAKVLVIRDPGSEKQGFAPHPERFLDGQVTFFGRYGSGLVESECREFLEGLDVVYSAETYYDWRFCDWARDMGVATVLHANPEFHFHWREPNTPKPDVWWSATEWRREQMPRGTRIVPMPVPIDRWAEPDLLNNPRKVLHVGGLEAIRDRNGTKIVNQVAGNMRDVEFITTSQKRNNVENYWELYENDAPVMLMPRRYGGLCLPTIEAMGAGKLVLMPDVSPNRMWPVLTIPAIPDEPELETQGGSIQLWKVHRNEVVTLLRDLFANSGTLERWRRFSYEWAQSNSWESMLPLWLQELEWAAEV